MEECGKIIFADGHDEPVLEYEKVYSVDPAMEIVKFKTKTNEYAWKPLSEEEIKSQLKNPTTWYAVRCLTTFICKNDHAFYIKKDGQWFLTEDVRSITLY